MTASAVNNHIIDAKDQAIGRVASRAALALRGKNQPDFEPHRLIGQPVKIINAAKLKLTSKRLASHFHRHSGYPGGLKTETLAHLLEKQGPAAALRRAVRGMLPANRLRREILKKLTIEN